MRRVNKKTIALVLADLCIVVISYLLAFVLYYGYGDNDVPAEMLRQSWMVVLDIFILVHLVFVFCKMYRSVWRLAGVTEVLNALLSCVILLPLMLLMGLLLRLAGLTVSIGIIVVAFILIMIFTVMIRFSYRLFTKVVRERYATDGAVENIMIIGGGSVGQELIREYSMNSKLKGRVCCIIDDNPAKLGKYLEGVRIVGGRDTILKNVVEFKIEKIIFAISRINYGDRAKILNICHNTDCKVLMVPGMENILKKSITSRDVREVKIEDLLGRNVQTLDSEKFDEKSSGRTVLVTGGGGSIGSELCRQLAKTKIAKLVIMDIYENTTYDIQQELKFKYPELDLEVCIGDMTDETRVDSIIGKYKPDIIFHAAAHKHVPLMEYSPNEAIKNNVFGTLNMAIYSIKHDVKRFILISTDKAVNPTNIMGASKRICEMIIQSMNGRGVTQFAAVRFGNVLGSNGSVIPLFKKQIMNGGPVTVTDPRIIRYFMTIPEAVSLVMEAAVSAKGGEIFVLDMGDPVKIDDLARNLIKLSGLTPDVDIKIQYIGLRPGEKLFEELLMAEEGLKETANSRIYVAKPIEMDTEEFYRQLEELEVSCHNESRDIRPEVGRIVKTYRYQG